MDRKQNTEFIKIFDKVTGRPIYKTLTLDVLTQTSDSDLTQLITDVTHEATESLLKIVT